MQVRYLAVLLPCLGLAACDTAKDSASNVATTASNETSASYNKIHDMFGGQTKKPVKVVNNIQPRYCYKVYLDIICYGKPIPGFENRLVAYQNTHGGTGYTLDPAPVIDNSNTDALPPLKTVNVAAPPAVKGEGTQLKEVIFDPADLEPKELVADPDKQE